MAESGNPSGEEHTCDWRFMDRSEGSWPRSPYFYRMPTVEVFYCALDPRHRLKLYDGGSWEEFSAKAREYQEAARRDRELEAARQRRMEERRKPIWPADPA